MKRVDNIRETLYDGVAMTFLNNEIIADVTEGESRVQIFDNPTFGRVMMIDGVTQLTAADEFIYHEMVAHVPMMGHLISHPFKVLVIGGGDGCLAREILKHKNVCRLVQVDISDTVINLSRQYLDNINGRSFEDPRLESVIQNGFDYVRDSMEMFDFIFVDSTDPIGPAAALFTSEFFGFCKERLNEGGALLTQSGVPFLQADELRDTIANLRKAGLDNLMPYLVTVPTYIGGQMVIIEAIKGYRSEGVNYHRVLNQWRAMGIPTRYYNSAVHEAAYKLPGYIRDIVW